MPFRDLVGHRRVLELTARAAARGCLPQSLIFAGPEGVGKRRAAIALAQLLNCTADPPDACGVCAACKRIARGVHADVLLIEPGDTGAIKVDQVRDAIGRAGYRPFEGRRRVVIVDDADAILPEAQNALLKTLEEPPPASTFILVTSRPDLLLPTVLSRCQRLRFGRLSPSDVADVLTRDHGYSMVEAQAAALAADGSVGLALEGGSEEFAEARESAQAFLQSASVSADPRRLLQGAQALVGNRSPVDRDEVARKLRAAASMLRDLGLMVSGADERGLANADLKPFLEGLRRTFDGRRTAAAFAAIDRALEAIDRNASPKIVADWLAFQI